MSKYSGILPTSKTVEELEQEAEELEARSIVEDRIRRVRAQQPVGRASAWATTGRMRWKEAVARGSDGSQRLEPVTEEEAHDEEETSIQVPPTAELPFPAAEMAERIPAVAEPGADSYTVKATAELLPCSERYVRDLRAKSPSPLEWDEKARAFTAESVRAYAAQQQKTNGNGGGKVDRKELAVVVQSRTDADCRKETMREESIANKEAPAVPPQRSEEVQANRVRARQMASQLGEDDERVVQQIRRIVNFLGSEPALAFLQQTVVIEANGGLLLPDGSRRPTPGGVFFTLLKEQGPRGIRQCFFHSPASGKQASSEKKPVEHKPTQKKPTPAPAPPAQFSWDERIAVLDELSKEKGTASTMKMTLIGRLGKIVDQGGCIVTVMQGNKVPALPKGLPVPAASTTNYVVYIAAKQWKNVAESIRDPEDVLIVEGFPQIDTKTGSIAVFVTKVTTKKLQAAKRQAQQQAAQAQG